MHYDPTKIKPSSILRVIEWLGYRPSIVRREDLRPPPGAVEQAALPETVTAWLSLARREDKRVILDFDAEWCVACRAFERDVLADPEFQQATKPFKLIRVDADTNPEVVSHFDVRALPTLLVLDERGRELIRKVGLIEPRELKEALARLKRRE